MLDIFERFFVTATIFSAIVAGIYRFGFTKLQHERFHSHMAHAFHMLSQVSWLESARENLFAVSRTLETIYGTKKSNDYTLPSFFTKKAWQTSALIVGSYIMIIPCVSLSFYLLYILSTQSGSTNSGVDIDKAIWILLILFLMVGAIIVIALYFWSRRSENNEDTSLLSVMFASVKYALSFGIVLHVIFGAMPSGEGSYLEQKPLVFMGLFCLAIVLTAYLVLRSIWEYEFLAPVFFLLALVLPIPVLVTLKMSLAIFGLVSPPPILGPKDPNALQIFAAIPVSLYLVSAILQPLKPRLQLFACLASIIYIGQLLVLTGVFDDSGNAPLSLFGYWGVTIYTIFIVCVWLYTPILANSVPDTVSVSFTRYCISTAARSSNFVKISALLIIDLLLAMVCVALSLAIFRAGAYLFEYSANLYMVLFGDQGVRGFIELAASINRTLDFAYYTLIRILNSFVNVERFSIFWPDGVAKFSLLNSGSYMWPTITVVGFALTGAIPTIINAYVLTKSSISRLVSFVVIQTGLTLHKLLTERDESGRLTGGWRSIALISSSFGLLIALLRLWSGSYSN